MEKQVSELSEQFSLETGISVGLEIVAKRAKTVEFPFSHPLVKTTRAIMDETGITPIVDPSTGDLNALIRAGHPGVTVGTDHCRKPARGKRNHSPRAALCRIGPTYHPPSGNRSGPLRMKTVKKQSWLENNTFHHGEFWDILKLVEEKEKKGMKISLCIPTLNEEKTIGKEVLILRSELMERYPLVDEFAVIDSGSQDKTLEVAGNYGADVYLASDILPEVGDKRGKGENLWKAIHQLKGDVICYVDADISNIHPRFVYGLVAPLIRRDEVHYVKAFYDRPSITRAACEPVAVDG